MVAAKDFIGKLRDGRLVEHHLDNMRIRCTLRGSLAFTGKGHSTDRAIALGLHGHTPEGLTGVDVSKLLKEIWLKKRIPIDNLESLLFGRVKILFLIKANHCLNTQTG
jgi:L-serine dehydratase